MGVYFFQDSRDVFGSFLMEIDTTKVNVNDLLMEFKAAARQEENIYYTQGGFQKFLDEKGIDNEFLAGACEITWR